MKGKLLQQLWDEFSDEEKAQIKVGAIANLKGIFNPSEITPNKKINYS